MRSIIRRQNIEDLILLRKLRRSQPGIDLEKLNRGEERRTSKKRDENAAEKFGLQSQKAKGEEKDECVLTSNFFWLFVTDAQGA